LTAQSSLSGEPSLLLWSSTQSFLPPLPAVERRLQLLQERAGFLWRLGILAADAFPPRSAKNQQQQQQQKKNKVNQTQMHYPPTF